MPDRRAFLAGAVALPLAPAGQPTTLPAEWERIAAQVASAAPALAIEGRAATLRAFLAGLPADDLAGMYWGTITRYAPVTLCFGDTPATYAFVTANEVVRPGSCGWPWS